MIKWIMSCVTSLSFSINVNGDHLGYFKGMRGLRQGDPLSPYLFTLVMEVFNLVLKRQISKSPSFKYHWLCKDLKLTHLCFADDHSVMETAGRNNILKVMPFQVGTLPVRYLGVPLISKRLYIKDCQLLIDKVKKMVFDRKNKVLSFAGRLQLVQSVLSSMQVFWSSVFILPKTIGYEIERLMRDFIWNYGEFKRGKAKGRSFWDILEKAGACWAWKNLLRLRPLFRDHIVCRIGDGLSTSLWYDNWHAICLLSNFISKREMLHYGISLNCKVADVIKDGKWDWPADLVGKYDGLSVISPPCLVKDKPDKVVWRNVRGRCYDFSVSEVWNDIRCRNDQKVLDNHNHLFFECEFPKQVWCYFKDLVKLDHAPYCLSDILNRSVEEVCNLISDVVWLRVLSLSLNPTAQVYVVADLWNFHVSNDIGSKKVRFVDRRTSRDYS
ncbi:RNA-directed DNA polymerase, eukaryota, reverse transcriptase zinc-binding domain protein [Tanacetum coccineum]